MAVKPRYKELRFRLCVCVIGAVLLCGNRFAAHAGAHGVFFDMKKSFDFFDKRLVLRGWGC
jgi:hypothetical protein